MENLFTTNIAVNNENVIYDVVFDKEQYKFISEAKNTSFPAFAFSREHDQWLDQDALPAEVKKQAVNALEKYLLRQH